MNDKFDSDRKLVWAFRAIFPEAAGEIKIVDSLDGKANPFHYAQNKEKFREIIYRSIRKHREKHNARAKLKYALKSGRMKKPDVCEMCNCRNKIHGHHEDYAKPLEVMWLCTACHGLVHRMKKQAVDSKVS